MTFRQTVDRWSSRPSIRGAAIVSEDGLLIHSMLDDTIDAEAVAALAVALLRDAQQFGTAALGGLLGAVVLDLHDGPAVVAALDQTHTLVVLAHPAHDIGPLLFDIRTSRTQLGQAV